MKISTLALVSAWGLCAAGSLVRAGELSTLRIRAVNPLPTACPQVVLTLRADSLADPQSAKSGATALEIYDGATNRALVTQAVDLDGNGSIDEWVFQADFATGETREFRARRIAQPAVNAARGGGRLVPERKDDFAWENDRIAFRIYGRRVEDELVSSGVDVWCKRTPALIIDRCAVMSARAAKTLTYYAGAGWEQSGRFADEAAWDACLAAFSQSLRSPIELTVSRTP